MASWTELEPARSVGRSIESAVRSASAADATGYALANASATGLQSVACGSVLAAVVRRQLEEQFTDGLDGDDVRQVVLSCATEAGTWLPVGAVSVPVLVAVVSSALGIHEPGVTYTEMLAADDGPDRAGPQWADPTVPGSVGRSGSSAPVEGVNHPPTPAAYAWHAPLLIASLLGTGRRPLTGYLNDAFAEIARSETIEMP
jgi:hypothetical protein